MTAPRNLLVFIFCAVSLWVSAQVNLVAYFGVATYRLDDQRHVQKNIQQSIGFIDTRIVSEFPPYWYYGIQATTARDKRTNFGLLLNYGSTGGRISYADYSGSFNTDQLLKYITLLPSISSTIKEFEGAYAIDAELRAGVTYTFMKLKSVIKIGEESESEIVRFRGLSESIEPSIKVTKRFDSSFIQLSGGYNFTIYGGKLKVKDLSGAYLVTANNNPARTDWGGFRFSLGAGYLIP